MTRRTDLAVRLLLRLSPNEATKAGALADQEHSTPGFVAQAMTPLVRAGWVRSTPGPTGGYTLATVLDQITVREVIEAIEGPTDTGRCVLRGGPCSAGPHCALHGPWTSARTALLANLDTTMISSLAPGA